MSRRNFENSDLKKLFTEYIPPRIVGLPKNYDSNVNPHKITESQQRILDLHNAGKTNQEIADIEGIDPKTVARKIKIAKLRKSQ